MRSMVKGNRAYEDVPVWLRVGEGDLRVDSGNIKARSFLVTDEHGYRRLFLSITNVADVCHCSKSTVDVCVKEGRKIHGKYTIEEVTENG